MTALQRQKRILTDVAALHGDTSVGLQTTFDLLCEVRDECQVRIDAVRTDMERSLRASEQELGGKVEKGRRK